MAESKAKSSSKKASDSGQAEVRENFEAEQEQGFRGREVDPTPNEEFSIRSGPDSPTAAEQRAAARQRQEG